MVGQIEGEILPPGLGQLAADKGWCQDSLVLILAVEPEEAMGLLQIPEGLTKFQRKGLLVGRDAQLVERICKLRESFISGGVRTGREAVRRIVPGEDEYLPYMVR